MREIAGIVIAFVTIGILVGCMKPQIVDPFADHFTEDEYLAIKIKNENQLGQLWEALPETDKDGNFLPLRWRETTIMLFPTGTKVNKKVEKPVDITRQAFEKVKTSGKITVAAIADLSAGYDSAYKYEAKCSSTTTLNMTTLRYTPKGRDYVAARLAANPDFKFAWLSAIYNGTSFVEVLKNAETVGRGNYAAFKMGADYFTAAGRSIVTTGPVIFQLFKIDPAELGIPVAKPMIPVALTMTKTLSEKLEPLSEEQLQEIKQDLPKNLLPMVE